MPEPARWLAPTTCLLTHWAFRLWHALLPATGRLEDGTAVAGSGAVEGFTVSGGDVTTNVGPGVAASGCTEGAGEVTAVGIDDGGTVNGDAVVAGVGCLKVRHQDGPTH